MKFIDFYCHNNHGREIFLNIFQYKRLCAFQFMSQFDDYYGSSGLIISLGHSSLFGISFQILRLGFSLDFFTWRARNLDWIKLNYFSFESDESHKIFIEEKNS